MTLSKTLQDHPLYEWVQVRAGRTPGDADGAGVNVDVELSDAALKDREASVQQLREAFLKLPGVAPNIGGFISHRMDEVLSGVRSAIAVKIFGPDLAELRNLDEQVRDVIQRYCQLKGANAKLSTRIPEQSGSLRLSGRIQQAQFLANLQVVGASVCDSVGQSVDVV